MKGRTLARAVRSDPVHWLAFGFGAGLSPVAPGTVGSLWGIALYLPLQTAQVWIQLLVGLAVVLVGIPICGLSARRLGVHDHSGIVWDEIAGCYLTLLAAPPGWHWIALGYALFRFFDIVKPRPIRDLDHRLGGGTGIMLDDVMAAVYAALALMGLDLFFNWLMAAGGGQ